MTRMESFLGPRISHDEIAAHRMHFLLPTLCLAAAAVLLVISIFLPYWKMVLNAPQYPGGLEVRAYLDHLEGDVREIDGLNHYIGMRPLGEAAELERSLSIAAVTVVALLVAGAIFIHTRWAALLALPALTFPAFFLLDLQYWLYDFGTNLDPKAPLSSAIDPFVPPVLGEGTVGQFSTVASPAVGMWLSFVACALVVVGLVLHRRAYKPLVDEMKRRKEHEERPAHNSSAGRGVALAACLLLPFLAADARAADAQAAESLAQQIAQAEAGDTLVVEGGVWRGPLRIERPIRLVGRGAPVIDGGGLGTVVAIEAPDVHLSGFVIRSSGDSLDEENSGIAVEAPRATLENNVLEDVLFGIYLRHADDSVLRGNEIHGKELDLPRRGDAVRVWYSHGVRLEANRVESSRDVVLWYSERLAVLGNRVADGRYGLHFMYCDGARIEGNELLGNSVGAFLMYSRRLRLLHNVIARNHGPSGYGVGLKDMDDAEVRANRFVGNRVGIFLDNTPREIDSTFLAEDNLLAGNDFGVTVMPGVRRAHFLGNSFVDNLEQVSVSGGGGDPEANIWRGNHWSDYAGFDADADGTGDVPHRLDRLFESLGDRQPVLRMFLHSPATSALDLASRAFPLVRPRPKLTDARPSMKASAPDAGLPRAAGLAGRVGDEEGASGVVATGVGLVLTALLLWLAPLLRRRVTGEDALADPSGRADLSFGAAPAEDACADHDQASSRSPSKPLSKKTVLEARGLAKHYGPLAALDGVDFRILEGESVALWGANGAGKTTALRALLGVIPYEGEVRVFGADSWRQGKAARRHLGFVPQDVTFQADLGVVETLELFARLRGAAISDLAGLLGSVGLEAHGHKRVGELSGGLRQRLALATALVDDPPLLLLDEPTANLDSEARCELLDLLQRVKAEGKTLVFSSHRAEEILGLADRVIHLEAGRVVADGAPYDVLADRQSELWLRPAPAERERADRLLRQCGFEARRLGEHLVLSLPANRRIEVFQSLLSAGVELVDFDLFRSGSSSQDRSSQNRPSRPRR